MSDITLVQGDSAPSISGSLTNSDGTPLVLTGAAVKFQMRLLSDRRFTVNANAAIVNAIAGTVRYDLVPGDLATAGDFEARWQVTLGGTVQHTQPANTITVASE